MQKVSNAYKQSMKDSLRERGYIMLTFGIINQEAQVNACIGSGEFSYFSSAASLFREADGRTVYATLEEDFTKVDGSMFFLPRRSPAAVYFDTGLVSEGLVSDGAAGATIDLHIPAVDFRGVTISFGENYPVDFDLITDRGQKVEVRGNDQAVYITETVFEKVTALTLIARRMKNPRSRFRMYAFLFGYGLTYYNDSVMASTLDSYISLIGADVPQIDFSVTLKNYNQYFNVDNPKSAIHFLETGQEMDVYYGYQLPESGEIEWVRGSHLLCSQWESDDYTATIRCQDVLRGLDGEFSKGIYAPEGKSYYDLALEVLEDAGQTDFYIDPYLKSLYTKNPLPRVEHRQALQIIANACRCVLSQTRTGTIQIKSSFIPKVSASCNGETAYSNVGHILEAGAKDEYATLSPNYTAVDGSMFFLPRSTESMTLYTGYVSGQMSDQRGRFETNPVVTLVQEAQCMYYGVRFVFGHALPSGIVIRTYNAGSPVTEYPVLEEITKVLVIHRDFDDFDTMAVEFTGTAEPYSRIVLNSFSFGDLTDFTMERRDMTSSPKAIKQEMVKEVLVPCYGYQPGAEEERLISEDIIVAAGESRVFYLGEPSYGFRVLLNDSTSGVSVTAWSNYSLTLHFQTGGAHKLEVFGRRYRIVEQHACAAINPRGRTVKWENPLVSDMDVAQDLADWLADYYRAGIEYEYDTRGNPELDVNDIIYQENDFHPELRVRVYRETLHFNQAFSGHVAARKFREVADDGVGNA